MSRMVLFFVALGVCAAFGGDYPVIDRHPPYKGLSDGQGPVNSLAKFYCHVQFVVAKKVCHNC